MFQNIILQYDIARGRVPRVETIRKQLEILVPRGLTGIQLYLEDVLDTGVFPAAGSGETRITEEYIGEIGRACAEFGIDLIPHIQIVAHLGELLEQPGMERFSDGNGTLRIDLPEVREKVGEWVASVAALFPSEYIHCGGDEAAYLGLGPSGAYFREKGFEVGFAEYVNGVNRRIRALGKTMVFYADEVIEYPRLAGLLDPEIVLNNWGYCFRDEVYEQENRHYANHARAVAGHRVWVSANNMAEYVFTPFARLEANAEIWMDLGKDAETLVISDWGSYENVNPYLLSTLGTLYLLERVRDGKYGIDRFAADVRTLLGYDSRFDAFFRDMLLLQSSEYLPFRHPLFPTFLFGDPDSRENIWHSAFLDGAKTGKMLDRIRAAEAYLRESGANADLTALANRLAAVALRMELCRLHSKYLGACWISRGTIDERRNLYGECLSRMKNDLEYLRACWDAEALPSCRERAVRYYQTAVDTLSKTLDFRENTLSAFPPSDSPS